MCCNLVLWSFKAQVPIWKRDVVWLKLLNSFIPHEFHHILKVHNDNYSYREVWSFVNIRAALWRTWHGKQAQEGVIVCIANIVGFVLTLKAEAKYHLGLKDAVFWNIQAFWVLTRLFTYWWTRWVESDWLLIIQRSFLLGMKQKLFKLPWNLESFTNTRKVLWHAKRKMSEMADELLKEASFQDSLKFSVFSTGQVRKIVFCPLV